MTVPQPPPEPTPLTARLTWVLKLLNGWWLTAFLGGLITTVLQHGIAEGRVVWEFGLVTCLSTMMLTSIVGLRWFLAEDRVRFWLANRRACIFATAWLVGAIILMIFGPVLPVWYSTGRGVAVVAWSELFLLLSAAARLLIFISRTTHRGNPALIFVVSFVGLILVGTTLLLLPGSYTAAAEELPLIERARIALFTATSASCVTGLVVVPTGGLDAYWTRFGQVVIMLLFQIGGLGMMSISAMFALLIGRQLAFRESAAVSEVTEAGTLRDVRHLLVAILAFTLLAEGIGAVFLSTLWPELPPAERAFFGAFHSISAFCNAGFTLTDNSFVGYGMRWQIWSVLCLLIIAGGLGFGTITSCCRAVSDAWKDRHQNGLFRQRRLAERLALSPRVNLTMTFSMLIVGVIGYWLLESTGARSDQSFVERISEAWFQSVTFRTAGFNTVDHGSLEPASKLFACMLMFVGACPGSTGGGVKTAAAAIIVLSLISILRGRKHVECHGRMIPDDQVRSAFVIIAMGNTTLVAATLLLLIFEPAGVPFINILFEATSAFATVGVSTGITADLSPPSQLVIIVTMFLGRVGPLTLMVAMTRHSSDANYQYPTERVSLG